MSEKTKGRVTVPTDIDIVDETIEIMERWGADALRDCDGTDMPEKLKSVDAKIYSTYYTTRKDNKWAEENPDEIQQVYLMTNFCTAFEQTLHILLMKDFYKQQLQVNTIHDKKRWWEVIDRTTGIVVSTDDWEYNESSEEVIIHNCTPFHDYTVSFLAFIIWDPVHMYNHITNDWGDAPHQMTYDVRQPKTQPYVLEKLKRWIKENPDNDVIRFTTFFHQFTLVFNQYAKEKFVDWFGYSASVSPSILEQFEKEVGYTFRPEYIIDQGYHNNTFRVPSKQYQDFIKFQQREVAKLMKKMVEITHEGGKEAMMFLGDHWIATEPFGEYFKNVGVDAVVGSVGNGSTLRLISEIPGVKYTEGRFLPYFFPDVFHEGGDPIREAKENWVTARRAILRKPVDRIGYGGYLKLALEAPNFVEYIENVCNEFRTLYENINHGKPYCASFKVAILNCWGKLRAWSTHMVAHALPYKQTYSYAGILEALSGHPFDIEFISFDDIRNNKDIFDGVGVVINVGDAYTAFSGGENWDDPVIVSALKKFVAEGGGLIGVGEPTAYQKQGKFLQLSNVLGVDKEIGFSLSTDKYNWEQTEHFITEDCTKDIDFGEGMKNIYALDTAKVLKHNNNDVQLCVNEFGKGKSVYISGLPYSFENARLLYRSIFWAAGKESELNKWFSTNFNVEVHAYPENGKYCVVNNTYEKQKTTVYNGNGEKMDLDMDANDILWFNI